MPYQSTKPLATDQLNQSQADLAGNFTAIGTQLDPNNGIVKFPRQPADVATAATDVGLYAKLSTRTAQTELFFRKQNSGTVIEFTSALGNTVGWTRLPSGILLKWGQFTDAGDPLAYTFPVGATIPDFANLYQVLITPSDAPGGHTFYVDTLLATGFTLHYHNGLNVRYLAIGD
jgi:hypothetical protein